MPKIFAPGVLLGADGLNAPSPANLPSYLVVGARRRGVGVSVSSGGAEVVNLPWYDSLAIMQGDPATGRYRINGIEYASEASAISAGAISLAADAAGAVAATLVGVNLAVDGITAVATSVTDDAAIGATGQYLISFDDGSDGVAADELIRLEWNNVSSGRISATETKASATLGTAMALNKLARSSMPVGIAVQIKGGDHKAVGMGVAPALSTGVGTPTVSRLVVGNRGVDGARPWLSDEKVKWAVYPGVLSTDKLREISGAKNRFFGSAYSWHMSDLFQYRNRQLYGGGYMMPLQDQVAFRYDLDNDKFTGYKTLTDNVYQPDDHSPVFQTLLADVRLLTGCTGHGDDHVMRIRVSTDDNPNNLGPEIQITQTEDGTGFTYGQFHQYGTKVWVTFRHNNQEWYIYEADISDLTTWVEKRRIYRSTDYQAYSYSTSTRAERYENFFGYIQPTGNPQNKLLCARWDKQTGDIWSGGALVGNINDALPAAAIIGYEATTAIRTPAALRSQRFFYSSRDGQMVVLADFVSADYSDCKYYVGFLTGGADPTLAASWTFKFLCNGGAAFGDGNYFGGASFANDPHTGVRVYVSRSNAGTWYIDQMDSADGGDNWTVTNLDSSATFQLIRPYSPVDAPADCPVVYQKGTYGVTFGDWVLDIVFYRRAA
jgi:hypothetical protein